MFFSVSQVMKKQELKDLVVANLLCGLCVGISTGLVQILYNISSFSFI